MNTFASCSSSSHSPWYDHNGWLGVKHQLTYLFTYSSSQFTEQKKILEEKYCILAPGLFLKVW